MARTLDATVLLIEGDDERASEYATWLDDCTVEVASDAETALDRPDDDVDVVLLDGSLATADRDDLLGRLRARHADCQIGLLSGEHVSADVLRLDFDEYVPRPVTRETLRETVERLSDRNAVMDVVETYLGLVARKRRLEARRPADELADDDRYRELVGELAARRRQADSLFAQLAASEADADTSETTPESVEGDPVPPALRDSSEPRYRTHRGEFVGLWLAAALTYGVGDLLSTTYAVLVVPGLIEGNPVVNTLLSTAGLPGFVLLKLLVFLVLISVSVQGGRTHERFSYYWPPVAMTILGLLLTGWNLRLIVSV
jgi:DNA-binding NarL/FixJ family response regulator